MFPAPANSTHSSILLKRTQSVRIEGFAYDFLIFVEVDFSDFTIGVVEVRQ